MIKTDIMLGLDGKFPICERSTGLAKTLSVAKWIFEYCGWKDPDGKEYPCLGYVCEVIEWPEGDQYFPCDMRELFVLNNRLIMN